MRYEYLCDEHGELELDHRITEDRKNQFCPKIVLWDDDGYDMEACGHLLKPLISHNSAINSAVPAVFKGDIWERSRSWKDAGTFDLADGPYREQVKAKRDPVAVR